MTVSNEQLKELAELGAKIITMQLVLASKDEKNAMQDLWVLGYCFGVFDALGRGANLDQYTDGLLLITHGFSLLMASEEIGAATVGRAIDSQIERVFFKGNHAGGSDIYDWFNDKKQNPLGLMNYLSFAPPKAT